MRFKPNYRIERAERDRLKKARKDEKLKRQQERVASRSDDGAPEPGAEHESPEADPVAAPPQRRIDRQGVFDGEVPRPAVGPARLYAHKIDVFPFRINRCPPTSTSM